MAGPRNATTDSRGRTYKWRDETFRSVTTLIGRGAPKNALPAWAARSVAEYAVDHLDTLIAAVKDDRAAAIDMLKGSPYRQRDAAAAKGSDIHAAVEAVILGRPAPEWDKDVAPSMAQFAKFVDEFTPTFEMSEASVYSRRYQYAGSLDFIATFTHPAICEHYGKDIVRLLCDTKTGKAVYGEVGLQLSAYRYADFIGLPDGSEVPMPEVDGAAVFHLRPRSYSFLPVRADETVFRYFLYVAQVAHFCDEVSRSAVGAPFATNETPMVSGQIEEVA